MLRRMADRRRRAQVHLAHVPYFAPQIISMARVESMGNNEGRRQPLARNRRPVADPVARIQLRPRHGDHARHRHRGAQAYAGEQSLRRLSRKCSAGAVFKPLSRLPALPGGIYIDNPPGMKNTDLVLRVSSAQGWVWYINDLLMNMSELPRNPLARFMVGIAGMKKGLCAPRMARVLNVGDKKAVGNWLLAELDARPPAVVVFGHGDPLYGQDAGARLKSVIRASY